jgi:hypothetical protein
MPLHLIKLCVGCDSIRDLEDWIEENQTLHRRLGRAYEQTHTTRMVPKRMGEIVGGGSLYWVIKGQLACRQRLMDIRPFHRQCGDRPLPSRTGAGGRPGRPAPLPAVPGLALPGAKDAPGDLGAGATGLGEMPEGLRRELVDLGLL